MIRAHVVVVRNIRSVAGWKNRGILSRGDRMLILEQSLLDLNKLEEALKELSVSL